MKRFISSVLLLSLSTIAYGQWTELDRELEMTYPKVPKKLDTDTTVSSLLLVDIDLEGIIKLNGIDGVALVTGGDGGEVIRAATMKGGLVMFHGLEPGTYSLRFIRLSTGIATTVLEKPPAMSIDVTVERGGVGYLGTIVVTKKFGPKPPEFQMIYDAGREGEAWQTFKEKYKGSPWTVLADGRILALRSPEKAPDGTIGLAASEGQDSANSDVPSDVTQADPLGKLTGNWDLTVFVIGAGQFGGPNCGPTDRQGSPPVTIAPPSDGAVSLKVACSDGSEYSFHLAYDSGTRVSLITVKSKEGISVHDFPVAYVEGQGWQGAREQLVEGKEVSITAKVAPIEGRNWFGWMIAVLPTAAVKVPDLAAIEKPYLRVDLTRRK